ncbi:MAG: SDR family NAD(P)-dependent oxidoreductase [Planctomycetota bacterium]|nr:SDR family NAD(P)-dependent oxidoreductase [Planctomycetota bacterium]
MNLDGLFAPFDPPQTNLVDRLRYWAAHQGEQFAFGFTSDGEDEIRLSYSQVETRARAIAAHLVEAGMQGERALLLYPPGLDFVTAFFGCLFAGMVAVPAYPPRRNRNMGRIQAISDDAEARIVLSVSEVTDRAQGLLDEAPHLQSLTWLATDGIADEKAAGWQEYSPAEQDLAVLQYTSGSTGMPKGVMLTHGNLIENCALITRGFETTRDASAVTWLPTYHDMGLVGGVLQPLFIGRPNVLMPPMAFLQKPIRWLRAISKYRVTIAGGPNFAYALCNEKITPEQCEGLDLSSWSVAFNGAEPIRAETLEEFTEKFGPYGFRAETHYPCYGLAETTLMVTGSVKTESPVVATFDADALERHEVIPLSESKAADQERTVRRLVSCGRLFSNTDVFIVDSETCERLEEGKVGEIWVSGPCVGVGYWKKPEETDRVFHAQLAGDDRHFLRTGDLGFIVDGQLFVTGRCKDLIIVRGRNLYPQDIEKTVESAHPSLQPGAGAAFSVEVENDERLIIVQEIRRQHRRTDHEEVFDAIRQSVLEEYDVPPHTILLLKAGKLPKTSSGKIQRSACCQQYEAGTLEAAGRWSMETDFSIRRPQPPLHVKPELAAPSVARTIQSWLVDRIAQQMHKDVSAIDVHESFDRFGLDSIALVSISGELEDWLGQPVSPTLLYSYPTIAALSEYLGKILIRGSIQESQTRLSRRSRGEPIAVVGFGCRFPGGDDPRAFWQLLRGGFDAVSEIPSDRWDVDRFYDPNPEAVGKMYTRRGGFLRAVDLFDPQFFSISPREAVGIDPQQRLLMEIAWETLEDAGQPPELLETGRTGVFVGISTCDYSRIGERTRHFGGIDTYTATGTATSIAAGRLAYFLGLRGPCMAIDTACSSSLVAVHQAVESLRKGECNSALAGGVNLILEPAAMVALSEVRALAPDGRCKTFDQSADGYARGEGCGMVLLKRLSDAVKDGDRVHALIRGSAVNHDGHSNGLTAPHGPSQEALVREAIADAGVEASDIDYVEAHGTGTSLGDPIEVQALAAVLGEDRPSDSPLLVGSVKTNIGHLESAAGIAGLIKVILALQHGEIPPHLHLQNPNPYIPWDDLPIVVPTQKQDWPVRRGPRTAGLSSFGFSGTNAHLILEQAPESHAVPPAETRPEHLLVLSAKSSHALSELTDRYCDQLENAEHFPDVCYTAATGRAHFPHRVAVLAKDTAQAQKLLEAASKGERAAGLERGKADSQVSGKIAFLFTGQGSQYVGMGRELYESQPTFRQALDRCHEILMEQFELPLLDVLYPADGEASPLDETAYTQPALFAIEYALYELWKSWGISPQLVVGHSVGEYMAAHAAGVFSLEDGLKLIATRGQLMQQLPSTGQMVALMTGEARVAHAIARSGRSDISIAAVNDPNQTVISGTDEAIDLVTTALQADDVRAKRLVVSHAFHSELMEPMLDDFEKVCREVRFADPSIPIVSNVYGRVVSTEIATPEYWRTHIRETVRFADGVRQLEKQHVNIFLEIGPNPILTASGRRCMSGDGYVWVPSLRESRGNWSQMLQSLADLYVRGIEIDWEGFDRDYVRRKVALPHYPFQRKRFWIDTPEGDYDDSDAPDDWKPSTEARGRSRKADDLRDGLYELEWQPRSRLDQHLPPQPHSDLNNPPAIREASAAAESRLQQQLALPRYQDFDRELDRLSAAYAVGAVVGLGWVPQPGDAFTVDALAEQLGVLAQHRRLFTRLLEIMVEEGILESSERKWSVVTALPTSTDPEQMRSLLVDRFTECGAELELLGRCGGDLAGVLSGKVDPLQLLFPNGSAELVERLYQDSPFARTLNALVEQAVMAAVERCDESRAIKILEIGAGTGGTSAQIIPRLPAERTEYVFTDISEIFTRKAQAKFQDYPFVRYGELNIEEDPAAQGFADGQFDLILAANVVHATEDLSVTMQNIRRLLAEGGVVVLLEGARPQRWLDLIFGLTEGWWRFTDTELRPQNPLISPEQWVRLLESCGYCSAVAMPEESTAELEERQLSAAPHVVVVAQNDQAVAEPTMADRRESAEAEPLAGTWLLLADREGVAATVASRIEADGGRAVLVRWNSDYEKVSDTDFLIDPSKAEHWGDIFTECSADGIDSLSGIVHCWSLDSAETDALNAEQLDHAMLIGCETLLHLIQQGQQAGWANPALWMVTRGAQPIGKACSAVAQTPLWGLGRVLAEELPQLWGGLIDVDPHYSTESTADILWEELRNPDHERQITYRDDQRFAARLVPRHSGGGITRPLRFKTDASYLVTGGLGDLGLKVATWMVEQGARQVLLLSRSEMPPRAHWPARAAEDPRFAERVEAIRKMEQNGARVLTLAGDVGEEGTLGRLLDEAASNGWPPLCGVVHAAGVVDADQLIDLEVEKLRTILRSKVRGTWFLHQACRDQPLDLFVNFSSGASFLGSPLLGAYAAANAFLDAMAHWRRAEGQCALTVNWGFWDEVGMVARSQRETGRGFAPQGMYSFSPEQGLAALKWLLEEEATQTAVMPADWPEWWQFHPRAAKSALFANLVQIETGQRATGITSEVLEEPSLTREMVAATAVEARPPLIEQFIREQLSRVLRIDVNELDLHQSLGNLGIDSLMAVELRNHVQASLGIVIPVAQLLQDPSISQLAEGILQQLDDAPVAVPQVAVTTQGVDAQPASAEEELSAEQALEKLDAMSDSEIEAMLSQMLDGEKEDR